MSGAGDRRAGPQDDARFFDALYEAHHRPLYAYLLGQSGDAEVAADLLQETFLRAWRCLGDLTPLPAERQPFWLFAVARNLLRDHLRRRVTRERHRVAVEEVAARQWENRAWDPVRSLEAREEARAVDAAVAHLPAELRVVLAMHLLSGMTSAQIGQALGRPAATVRSQIAQARRRIAAELGLIAGTPAVQPRER